MNNGYLKYRRFPHLPPNAKLLSRKVISDDLQYFPGLVSHVHPYQVLVRLRETRRLSRYPLEVSSRCWNLWSMERNMQDEICKTIKEKQTRLGRESQNTRAKWSPQSPEDAFVGLLLNALRCQMTRRPLGTTNPGGSPCFKGATTQGGCHTRSSYLTPYTTVLSIFASWPITTTKNSY